MTRVAFDCDRCGTRVTGLHTASGTAGFFVVSEGHAFSKYGREGENFVCEDCILAMPEFRASHGLPARGEE